MEPILAAIGDAENSAAYPSSVDLRRQGKQQDTD
jgi:hypothetical protein